jgi:hypothetical protein
MKKFYYIGLILLGVFEILNVYFIMPMPGSQQLDTVELAYFLHSNRWIIRGILLIFIIIGALDAFNVRRFWIPIAAAIPVIAIAYAFNFRMTADRMFLQPRNLSFHSKADNTLNDSSIIVAVTDGAYAKAYPIRYIQYHHQVRDSVGDKAVMVTYCNVCRTGRVFEPVVKGKLEDFRLVGMDHFNAMFEDKTTGTWWRQATGEAVAGSLKGESLPELYSTQTTLNNFFSLYPFGKVMATDHEFKTVYDTLGKYEKGKSKGQLTRTDSLSWQDKSWVVGIQLNEHAKAYDWNRLKMDRAITDQIGGVPVVIVLASDDHTFAAFIRPSDQTNMMIQNDSLVTNQKRYDFAGRAKNGERLKPIKAYQEFWHSWKQFHPSTERYGE